MTEVTRTLAEIQPHVGAPTTTIDNWVVRLKKSGVLRGTYAPSVQGRERVFTRANTLELALISAMVRTGIAPKKAALYADAIVQRGARREWMIFAAGDPRKSVATDTPDVDAVAKKFSTDALSLVRVGEIVRRVDKIFSEGE